MVSSWYLGSFHWRSDRAKSTRSESSSEPESRAGFGLIFGRNIFPQPTEAVVSKAWTRAKRSPIKLTYLIYPVFGLYSPISNSIEAGEVTANLAVLFPVYLSWAVGAAFCLNPLGDEGSLLPVTVTTGVPGRRYVQGRLFSALIPGLPVLVITSLGLGIASRLSVFETGALVFLAVVAVTASTVTGVGIGSFFPRFESVRVARNTKAVIPSVTAFGVHSLVFLMICSPATVGILGVEYFDLPTSAKFVALFATTFLAFFFSVFSYYYAVAEFENFTLE